MDQDQSKSEHKARIVTSIAMAIQHAALLCPSLSAFIAEMTTVDALNRTDSLGRIRDRKRGLGKAEQHLLSAAEALYALHASDAWIASRDYEPTLLLLWHGVAEGIGGYGSDLQVEEQRYQDVVIRPRILASFETVWVTDKAAKAEKARERKLEKLRLKSLVA